MIPIKDHHDVTWARDDMRIPTMKARCSSAAKHRLRTMAGPVVSHRSCAALMGLSNRSAIVFFLFAQVSIGVSDMHRLSYVAHVADFMQQHRYGVGMLSLSHECPVEAHQLSTASSGSLRT